MNNHHDGSHRSNSASQKSGSAYLSMINDLKSKLIGQQQFSDLIKKDYDRIKDELGKALLKINQLEIQKTLDDSVYSDLLADFDSLQDTVLSLERELIKTINALTDSHNENLSLHSYAELQKSIADNLGQELVRHGNFINDLISQNKSLEDQYEELQSVYDDLDASFDDLLEDYNLLVIKNKSLEDQLVWIKDNKKLFEVWEQQIHFKTYLTKKLQPGMSLESFLIF